MGDIENAISAEQAEADRQMGAGIRTAFERLHGAQADEPDPGRQSADGDPEGAGDPPPALTEPERQANADLISRAGAASMVHHGGGKRDPDLERAANAGLRRGLKRRAAGLAPQEPGAAPAPAAPSVGSVHERTASAEFRMLLLEEIRESPTNPRRSFEAASLAELAADVQKHGVLEPILVRPIPEPDKPGRYEVVFGARRLRAAQLAKLRDIPARLIELTDLEVVELQLAENLQRADLHPLEEAEAFDLLHREHKLSVQEIADRYAVGKSASYVYARLKLCALTDKATRDAFLANKLDASTALLIARVPNERLQREFGRRVALGQRFRSNNGRGSALSYREALEVYHQEFMLRLADAPFSKGDAQLVPEAGACTQCPKRTGNQRELFADVQSADVCTDPPCFQAKKKAWQAAQLEAARAAGQTVIDGKKAKELMPYPHAKPHGGGVLAIDETCYEDPQHRTYRKLLGKALEEPVSLPAVVVSPFDGSLHEVIDQKSARRMLREAGHKFAQPAARPSTSSSKGGSEHKAREKRDQLDAEAAELLANTAVERLADLAEKDKSSGRVLEVWLGVAPFAGIVDQALKRRGVKAKLQNAGLKEPQLRGVFLEAALLDEMDETGNATDGALLNAAARAYKLDLGKLEKEIRARLSAESQEEPAKGKKAAGKKKGA